MMSKCEWASGRSVLSFCRCRHGSDLNPVYVRRWPLVRMMSLSSALGVPVATVWDFRTWSWNAWNFRCHFKKNILAAAGVIHAEGALAMSVCECVCVSPTVAAYIWTTSWHINHTNGSNMNLHKGLTQSGLEKTFSWKFPFCGFRFCFGTFLDFWCVEFR